MGPGAGNNARHSKNPGARTGVRCGNGLADRTGRGKPLARQGQQPRFPGQANLLSGRPKCLKELG